MAEEHVSLPLGLRIPRKEMQMKTFAVTFAGLATKYIEAGTKDEAVRLAWDDLIKGNEGGGNLLRVVPVTDEAPATLNCSK